MVESKPKRKLELRINKKALLLVGAVILAGVVYYFLPQTQARIVAGRLHPALGELKDSLNDIDGDLGDLFYLISGEELPQSQTSNLPQSLLDGLEGQVAGESAKFAFYDLLYQLRGDVYLIRQSFSSSRAFGRGRGQASGEVAGARITQAEDESVTELRQVMTQARDCESSVDTSRDKIDSLSSSMPGHFPGALSDVGDSLSEIVQDGGNYISEADKTSHYYEVLSEVQIELVPTTISVVNLVLDLYEVSDPTLYLDTIEELMITIGALGQKIEALSDYLPEGMDKLHADNLAVFDLFAELLSETQVAVSNGDFYRFDDAVVEFDIGLELLATRAKTYELSFWQGTELFKDYKSLSSLCDQVEGDLGEFAR
jgi:hypothetical protein